MRNEHITHITDDSFDQEVKKAGGPVLLDFWAPWCGPCNSLAPILDDIAAEHVGRLKVVKMDVDQNRAIPAKYGIRGIPSLLLFKGGEVVAAKSGAVGKAQLSGFIKDALDP